MGLKKESVKKVLQIIINFLGALLGAFGGTNL